MPAHKASPIQLSPEQECRLKASVRAHLTPQNPAERPRIILLASTGLETGETAVQLGLWRKTACDWRRRWQDTAPSAGVAARLSDAPRCGTPATFSPEAICRIIVMPCEDPETLDVPISHWSQSDLAGPPGRRPRHRRKHLARLRRAFIKREAKLNPHLIRYWLTPKPDPDFDTKCADICAVYEAAPAAAEQGGQTVPVDQ
nr:hypothetical protein [uncultured Rhodopila sp.]